MAKYSGERCAIHVLNRNLTLINVPQSVSRFVKKPSRNLRFFIFDPKKWFKKIKNRLFLLRLIEIGPNLVYRFLLVVFKSVPIISLKSCTVLKIFKKVDFSECRKKRFFADFSPNYAGALNLTSDSESSRKMGSIKSHLKKI